MKSITIHNLDDKLDSLIREKAKKQGISLNKTIKTLLRKSLGLGKNIEKDSIIQTDGWNGYNNLDSNGFRRCVLKDTANVGTDPMYHCHLIISLFKRWLLGTYQGASGRCGAWLR